MASLAQCWTLLRLHGQSSKPARYTHKWWFTLRSTHLWRCWFFIQTCMDYVCQLTKLWLIMSIQASVILHKCIAHKVDLTLFKPTESGEIMNYSCNIQFKSNRAEAYGPGTHVCPALFLCVQSEWQKWHTFLRAQIRSSVPSSASKLPQIAELWMALTGPKRRRLMFEGHFIKPILVWSSRHWCLCQSAFMFARERVQSRVA